MVERQTLHAACGFDPPNLMCCVRWQVLATNRLDGRAYAIKKIRMSAQNPQLNHKILREVATLSRLQHTHVVRYFQVCVTSFSNV